MSSPLRQIVNEDLSFPLRLRWLFLESFGFSKGARRFFGLRPGAGAVPLYPRRGLRGPSTPVRAIGPYPFFPLLCYLIFTGG